MLNRGTLPSGALPCPALPLPCLATTVHYCTLYSPYEAKRLPATERGLTISCATWTGPRYPGTYSVLVSAGLLACPPKSVNMQALTQ